jgi:hypothetical protein
LGGRVERSWLAAAGAGAVAALRSGHARTN